MVLLSMVCCLMVVLKVMVSRWVVEAVVVVGFGVGEAWFVVVGALGVFVEAHVDTDVVYAYRGFGIGSVVEVWVVQHAVLRAFDTVGL